MLIPVIVQDHFFEFLQLIHYIIGLRRIEEIADSSRNSAYYRHLPQRPQVIRLGNDTRRVEKKIEFIRGRGRVDIFRILGSPIGHGGAPVDRMMDNIGLRVHQRDIFVVRRRAGLRLISGAGISGNNELGWIGHYLSSLSFNSCITCSTQAEMMHAFSSGGSFPPPCLPFASDDELSLTKVRMFSSFISIGMG